MADTIIGKSAIDTLSVPQTPRRRMIAALERRPVTGRVPTFELVFFLTMEKFGRLHPSQRYYGQWDQMSKREQQLHRDDMASLYIETAAAYGHDAIFVHPNPGTKNEVIRLLTRIRELSGDRYFIMMHGDATFSIPDGSHMVDFAFRMADQPELLHAEAQSQVEQALAYSAELQKEGLLDGFALCSDYCFNTGPFLSPNQFSEFVAPYLARLIQGYRDQGFYTIKHTDGNIMPIIDQLVQANPHALHSLDPQAGVDIAEVKRLYGKKVCLIGNVNCGLLETGTDEQVIESARYALRNGMPGYGYIFSTSNCVYTGMPLERYDLIIKVLNEEGRYAND
ncbi:MAG: uroporphyrinogen decarboxylase family protein [Clostridiaceae bacterium]|nr:uroporphyrinogen decarboxylase family protein [Clostridiaceae bacterium]